MNLTMNEINWIVCGDAKLNIILFVLDHDIVCIMHKDEVLPNFFVKMNSFNYLFIFLIVDKFTCNLCLQSVFNTC
jgi:hypothetical protein